jgi:hypothetical protein
MNTVTSDTLSRSDQELEGNDRWLEYNSKIEWLAFDMGTLNLVQ